MKEQYLGILIGDWVMLANGDIGRVRGFRLRDCMVWVNTPFPVWVHASAISLVYASEKGN